KLQSLIFREAERRCAPLADVIAFVGNELRDFYLAAGIGTASRTVVIRSPIEIERYLATRDWTPSERLDARRRLGIGGTGALIVALGVIALRKRYNLMIRQLRPVLASSDAQLVIAGEGDGDALRGLATQEGIGDKLILLGHVSDVASLLAVATVMVHAADVEGVPQVEIQALAAGRPVIAT